MNDGAKLRICTFCGHNKIYSAYEDVKAALHNRVEVAIKKDYYNYFLIGNYGSFDRLAAAVCLSAKKDNQHIMVNLVVPYYRPVLDDLEKEWYSRFDSVIVPELEKTPYPYRIIKANEYMVDCAELVIAYVTTSIGGAAKTLEYAQRKKKVVINLHDRQEV